MGIDLFDTHCDTPYEIYLKKEGLRDNSLHVSLEYAKNYDHYCQCAAIWSDKRLGDDAAYEQFLKVYQYFGLACQADGTARLCRTYEDITLAHKAGKSAFVLTVEDARLLSNDIKRLDTLRDAGVKMLTFQWQGETCIGGGFDTDAPLSDFGKEVARRCVQYGIIPDISHACERTARDIIEITAQYNKPVIATHSNSYSVCAHKRNMTDALFDTLIVVGGIVGISLAPQHLTIGSHASTETVLFHIEHYAERAGIGCVCLGCDLDGIDRTPVDVRDLRQVENIAECMLSHNYTEDEVRAVFSENARRFMKKNLTDEITHPV